MQVHLLFQENLIENANSAIWHAVLIGISMSIIYSVIFVLFPKYIFMSMGGDNDVLEGAVNFYKLLLVVLYLLGYYIFSQQF